MESEFHKESIKISLTVPEKDFYIILSEDKEGKHEVERKFKDLFMLQKNLAKRWLGCYVPYIPKNLVSHS